ncbi:hypothetical protein QZJ86_12150 [Methylomonas montana]|uniref:hypothetical protein n=1 Tax=Methylomonas montana TaxID=3058963 RepID=UPI002658732F|nr:hypothetical protein [Methylomonas montana]WKJ88774.1 hypothetical protein QZJ86_12150 [Methylomonas montana]
MSKIILYGTTANKRAELAHKLLTKQPDHRLVDDWDGVSAIEANTLVSTDLMPPFETATDCLMVAVGLAPCPTCGE